MTRHRFLRISLFSVLGLLILVLLAMTAISLVLSTSAGSRWALERASAMLETGDSSLSYAESSGTLLWGMNLRELRYQSGNNVVTIESLSSRWNPWPLLYRQFNLESLRIEGLEVQWASTAAEDDTVKTRVLINWEPLPVNLTLNNVSLEQASISYNGNDYQLNSLALDAGLSGDTLRLSELEVDAVDLGEGLLNATAALELSLQGAMPMQGELHWHYRGPIYEDVETASGQLNWQGDLDRVELEHHLREPVALLSEGILLTGFTAAQAQALSIDLNHFLLQEEVPVSALTGYHFETLQLQSVGTLEQLHLNGSSILQSALLPRTELSLRALLEGRQLTFEQLEARTPSATLTAVAVLDWENALALSLDYVLEERDPTAWLTSIPEQLQAGVLSSSGQVNLSQNEAGLQGEISVDSFEGSLNDYPLSGQGTVSLVDGGFLFQDLRLQSGDNQLSLSGSYAQSMDLHFAIEAPTLEQLYAGVMGNLNIQGSLQGTARQPRISLDGNGSNLVFGDIGIAGLVVQGAYSDANNTLRLQLDDASLGNQQGSIQVQQLSIEASGQPDVHQFSMDMTSDLGQLSLSAAGGLESGIWRGNLQEGSIQSEVGNWQLEQAVAMLLSSGQVSLSEQCWQQEGGPAGQLCFAADWNPDELAVDAQLNEYPLAVLNAPVFVNTLTERGALPANHDLQLAVQLPANMAIDGELSAVLQLRGDPGDGMNGLGIIAGLSTGPGTLLVSTESIVDEGLIASLSEDFAVSSEIVPDVTISRFSWPAASVRLEGSNNNWQANGSLDFEQQDLDDSATIMRGSINTSLQMDPQQNLNAQLDLAFDDLNFVEAFLPQLQQTQGQLNSRIRVTGTLDTPHFSGDLLLENASSNIPALGLELRQLQATLSSEDGSSLRLNGRLQSGEGSLQIESEMQEPLSENRVLDVRLSGTDFQLVQLPDLSLNISPDMQLHADASGIHVTGLLQIPHLNVQVSTLPETAVDVSGDTVLVTQRENTPEVRNAAQTDRGILSALPLTGEIRLELGEDVRFSGFGLTAGLEGGLDINQRATGSPLAYGELSVVDGSYTTYGQTLEIEHGKLLFFGTFDNPGLDIRAVREAENVKVGVQMNGTLRNISSQLFSTPTLPDGEIIAVLLTGRPFSEIGNQEGNALVGAITTLGINQGQSLTNQIRNQLGLDTLSIASSGDTSDSSLMLGKYLTPRIFIRYAVGLFDTQSVFAIDYSISERVKLEATSGQNQSIDLTYTRER